MLSRENFTIEHINQLKTKNCNDAGLIERTVFAFGLLEALVETGLKFIFKGGSCLLLLLPAPLRLSTDIDIVVPPGTQIEEYIVKARAFFPFIKAEEVIRKAKGGINKRHFKFFYNSRVAKDEPMFILLDVLYEENFYQKTVEKEIENSLLITEGDNLFVTIPSADCILGDKLTAFAPFTTGIEFGDKNMEIMKQFFDINSLIDEFSDFECLRNSYFRVSETEIGYRRKEEGKTDLTPEKALLDTLSSAICIASRGKYLSNCFDHFLDGTRRVTSHIFSSDFSMEIASRYAPRIIYLAACLLTNTPFSKVDNQEKLLQETISQEELRLIKGFRKLDPMAYGYLVKADRLLAGRNIYPNQSAETLIS